MDPQDLGGSPLSIRFIPGRAKDGATQSVVRSHAMTAFRSRQRHQKQLGNKRNQRVRTMDKAPIGNAMDLFCHCMSLSAQRNLPSNPLADGRVRCDQCGRNQLSIMSPSQQMVFLQRQHSAITTFAAAEFDPFGSMTELPDHLTSRFSREINAIKKHAISCCSPGPIKSIVFPEAVRTPALMTSMLYMAYASLSSARGWTNDKLALGLKTAAISHVNRKLSHPSTAMCTNTIASIAYLSTGTWTFGNAFEEVQIHMTGMELMVKQRGMRSLGVYPFGQTIRKYLVLHHAVVAAISAQPTSPAFDIDVDDVPTTFRIISAIQESPLYCPSRTFEQVRRSKRCSQATLQIIYGARDLIDLLLSHHENEEVRIEISMVKAQLESHLSANNPQSPSHGDWIFESCRVAALIILQAVEQTTPLASCNPLLTDSLVQALEKTDIGGIWGDMLGVLYWVLMIGLASTQKSVGHKLLGSTLIRAMFEIAFMVPHFDYALRPIQRFAMMQEALKQRAQLQYYQL